MNYTSILKFGFPAVLLSTGLSTLLFFIFYTQPLAAFLINFICAFAGLLIYSVLNHHYSNNGLDKFSLSLSNLLLGVCIAMLFFNHMKLYSLVTFSFLFLLLLSIEYLNKIRFMYRFYRAYLVAVIVYYICLMLFGKTYSNIPIGQTTGLMFGPVHFESVFCFFCILLLAVYLFELFKLKFGKN